MFSFLPSTLPLGPGFCVWFLPQVGLHHDVLLVLTCLAYCLGRTWPLTSPMWAWSAWSACMAPRQFDQHQTQIFPPSLKSHDFSLDVYSIFDFHFDQGQAQKLPVPTQPQVTWFVWYFLKAQNYPPSLKSHTHCSGQQASVLYSLWKHKIFRCASTSWFQVVTESESFSKICFSSFQWIK